MKNQVLFCFLALCAFSCSKNVEEVTPLSFEEKILGEWQIQSFVINSCPNASNNVPLTIADDGCLDMWGETVCTSINLNAEGKAEIRTQYGSEAEPFTDTMIYEMDADNSSIRLCYEDFESECVVFSLNSDRRLANEMDEDGCICTFGYSKAD